MMRSGLAVLCLLALAACDKPQSSSSGASKDGTLSDKYDRDRDSCRTQVSEYMRGRLLVEDTLAVINGRTIHAYHIEGTGGGHAPDLMRLAGEPNVLTAFDRAAAEVRGTL